MGKSGVVHSKEKRTTGVNSDFPKPFNSVASSLPTEGPGNPAAEILAH